MAAIPVSAPETPSDPRGDAAFVLVRGLVAFVISFAAFIADAVLPNPQPPPVAVLAAANRAGPATVATWHDAARLTGDLALRTASSDLLSSSADPVSANHCLAPIAMDEHQPPDHGLRGPGAHDRTQKGMAAPYHLMEFERGTRSESAHSATMALHHDLRVDLAAMAAAQRRPPVGNPLTTVR